MLLRRRTSQLSVRSHLLLRPRVHSQQTRDTRLILTCLSLFSTFHLWSRSWHLRRIIACSARTLLECFQQCHDRLRRQVLVVIIVDLHHWRIDTGAQTLHFQQTEYFVVCHLARMDAQVFFDSFHDLVTSATTQHAWRRCTDLNEVFSNW